MRRRPVRSRIDAQIDESTGCASSMQDRTSAMTQVVPKNSFATDSASENGASVFGNIAVKPPRTGDLSATRCAVWCEAYQSASASMETKQDLLEQYSRSANASLWIVKRDDASLRRRKL